MTSPPDDVYEAAARALNIVWGYDQTLDAEDFERAVATDAKRPALRKAVDTGYAAGVAAGRAQAAAAIRAAWAGRDDVVWLAGASWAAKIAGGEPR